MKYDWRQLSNFFQRLSPRERALVGVAVGAVLVIGLYSFVWERLATGRAQMGRRIEVKEAELRDMRRLRETYLKLLRQFEASQAVLAKVDKGFSLFSHIEGAVSQVVSRDRIASMNPGTKIVGNEYREESVEIRLTGISLQQLVDMMYRVEKGPQPLRVTRLQVKKRPTDPHSFDVTVTVSMLQALDA